MPYVDKEKALACRRAWWARNREKMNAHQKKRREDPTVRAQRAEWSKRHKEANPDAYRDRSYRHKYGITLADYNRMFAEQGGRCAICEELSTGGPDDPYHRLHVDHNHEKDTVRQLLCRRCNVAIGYLEHLKPGIFRAAVDYLNRHDSPHLAMALSPKAS